MAMVCHMDKLKKNDLNGVRKEDDRSCDAINKKNPDLDLTKTKDNYTICQNRKTGEIKIVKEFKNGKTLKWDETIKRRVRYMEKQNLKNGGKRFRKDAVVCGSFIMGADKEFMDKLSFEEQRKYFLMMYNFMGNHYGFENIASFTVHMDEGTVGGHCRIFPLKDGKLCAKELFTPASLAQVQRELYNYLKKEFPELQAPDFGNSKRKHLDEMTYKYQQEKTKLDDLEKQVCVLKREIGDLSNEKEKLKDSCLEYENRFKTALESLTRVSAEIDNMQLRKESLSFYLEKLEKDLPNLISLRDELSELLNRKAHGLGLGFKQSTDGYILDVENGIRKARESLSKMPAKSKKKYDDRER